MPFDPAFLAKDGRRPAKSSTSNSTCPWCGEQIEELHDFNRHVECPHCARPSHIEQEVIFHLTPEKTEACERCGGTGDGITLTLKARAPGGCPDCDGTGKTYATYCGHLALSCPTCRGSGQTSMRQPPFTQKVCPDCKGSGRITPVAAPDETNDETKE